MRQVTCTVDLLKRFCVYLTVYDRASLPVLWGVEIAAEGYRTPPLATSGFYLLRVHPKVADRSGRHGGEVADCDGRDAPMDKGVTVELVNT